MHYISNASSIFLSTFYMRLLSFKLCIMNVELNNFYIWSVLSMGRNRHEHDSMGRIRLGPQSTTWRPGIASFTNLEKCSLALVLALALLQL